MIRRDRELTATARFEDDRSYIAKDGRHVLYGEDWKQRKAELWKRSGGRCEQWMGKWGSENHDRCTAEAVDPHHLIRRSELRDDRLANLQALCRFHHDLLDRRQPRWKSQEKEQLCG